MEKKKEKRNNIIKILNFKFSKIQGLIVGITVLAIIVGTLTFSVKTLKNIVKEKENKTEGQVTEKITKQEDKISLTLKNIEIEVNSEIPAKDDWEYFVENISELTEKDKEKFENIDLNEVDSSKEGKYNYSIKYNNVTYNGTITIKKSIEPTQEVIDQEHVSTPQNVETVPEPNQSNPSEIQVPIGSWIKNGFTITSNGTKNVTISYKEYNVSGLADCASYSIGTACHVSVGQGPSTDEVLFITEYTPSTTNFLFSTTNDVVTLFDVKTPQEYMSKFNLSYTGKSYSTAVASDSGNDWESAKKIDAYRTQNSDNIESLDIAFTFDSNFRCNGTIVIEGIYNGKGYRGTPGSIDYKQVYLN